ncbi:MAG TPA: fatty acid desaturase [Polyangiaceae bacterium]|nr:fatty acid desaturase [Polyangiaceae bacterium]
MARARSGTPYQSLDWARAGFQFYPSAEPHRERRRRLLREHPWIRELFGVDRKTAVVTAAVWVLQLACAGACGRTLTAMQSGWAAKILVLSVVAYAVGTLLAHWLAMSVHETSHGLVFETRWLNKALALFANVPLVFPMAMAFHRYHLGHHVHLGKLGLDTDLPTPWEAQHVRSSRLKKLTWLSGLMAFYIYRGLLFSERPQRWEWLNYATQAVTVPLMAWAFGAWGLGFLMLSVFFSLSLHPVAAHFVHEHYVFHPQQETYSYYGPLNRIAFNVGYHVEHHDFMNIPGSRLPELHERLASIYRPMASHSSWTGLLLEFICRTDVGVQSRIVR